MAAKVKSTAKRSAGSGFPEWAFWAVVGTALVLLVTAFFYFRAHPPGKPGEALLNGIPGEVGPDEAFILLNRDAFFLDIRSADEWSGYHIEKSVSIPLEELAGRLDEIPIDSLIVVVDRTGELGPQGRDLLAANGYTRVTSLSGGIQGWIAEGYSVLGTVPY